MSESSIKPSNSYWAIVFIALIWNLIGVFFYLQLAYMTSEELALLPNAQQLLLENTPAWVTAAFALSVFGGTLGCILLLMRKKLATFLFIISLISIVARMSYYFFIKNAAEVYAPEDMYMSALVIIVAIFLLWYSKKMESIGILD